MLFTVDVTRSCHDDVMTSGSDAPQRVRWWSLIEGRPTAYPSTRSRRTSKRSRMAPTGSRLTFGLTADGHLVCVHDRTIDRTSNGAGVLSTLELADLQSLDFGGWQQTPGSGRAARPGQRRPTTRC